MYKMYFLTLYNISPIQQGIQSWHCAIEYSLKYYNHLEYIDWANNYKTFIILNWWTTETLKNHISFLEKLWVKYATFQEPDLWGITTCVSFIAKEWDEITNYFTKLFRLA